MRISKHCYLSFDCRGDSPKQVAQRRGKDFNHWQLITMKQVWDFFSRKMKGHHWSITELGGKEFPVVMIEVKKCLGLM